MKIYWPKHCKGSSDTVKVEEVEDGKFVHSIRLHVLCECGKELQWHQVGRW